MSMDINKWQMCANEGRLVTEDGKQAYRVRGYWTDPVVCLENTETKELQYLGIYGATAGSMKPITG